MKFSSLLALLFFSIQLNGYAQCATSGTINVDCTTNGNLSLSGDLTVVTGVTVTVTGTLTILAGRTLTGTGATFSLGNLAETYGSTNAIVGGTYNFTDFASGSGGFMSISNATLNSSGSMDLVQATVTNSTVNVGTNLYIGSGISAFSGSTLDIGTANASTGVDAMDFNGGADLSFTNGTTVAITGDVDGGSGADITINDSDVTVSGNFDNVGNGSVTVENDGSLSVGGDFDNSGGGDVGVEDGGSIAVDGDYNNSGGGTTDVDGGTIVVGENYEGDPPTGDAGDCDGGSGGCCGSGCGSLPVSLIDFKVNPNSVDVTLSWSTGSELNNDFFTIEKSYNAHNYTFIGRVSGSGTSNAIMNYEFSDQVPSTSGQFIYYRLSQTDFDGTHVNLKTRVIDLSDQKMEVTVYPSVVKQGDLLHITGIPVNARWTLYTLTGSFIKSDVLMPEGSFAIPEGIAKGEYILTFTSDLGSVSKRVMIE